MALFVIIALGRNETGETVSVPLSVSNTKQASDLCLLLV